MNEDTQLLDWLEGQFTGRFRNSIFLANEIGDHGSLLLDSRQHGTVIRAGTVRELLRLAMQAEPKTRQPKHDQP